MKERKQTIMHVLSSIGYEHSLSVLIDRDEPPLCKMRMMRSDFVSDACEDVMEKFAHLLDRAGTTRR